MSYVPFKVTERILKVREEYKNSIVAKKKDPYTDGEYRMFQTGDRWITTGFLKGWQKYKGETSTRIRRSLAEAEEMYLSEPVFYDDELLAGHLYLPNHTEEEQKEYDKMCDSFEESSCFSLHVARVRKNHIGLDFGKILRVGIEGILKEIEECEIQNQSSSSDDYYPDFEAVKRDEFYKCCKIELEAMLDLARRYSEKAEELAQGCDEKRKSELMRISNALKKVPYKPAETFFEALQSVQFVLSTLFGLFPLNRPDRYLIEYYEKDIENNVITKAEAQELIDNFCLCISTRVFSRAACGFIVGGYDEKGQLVENDLTYMFITALEHIKMADPNGALAVNEKTSDEILNYSAEILAKGITHPAFYNDEVIIKSLENYGVEHEDAVNYIHSTCAEISVAGKSRAHSTPFLVNLPSLLIETVKENLQAQDFNNLFYAYIEKLSRSLKNSMKHYLLCMLEASRNGAEPMRVSCFIDNCIKEGKSAYEGGEKYCFIQPIFIGFATTIDSLYAIKELVYNKKEIELPKFLEITENDYKNEEAFRLHIINKLPHYGNDIAEIDDFAGEFAKIIETLCADENLPAKKYIVPGTFSYVNHATIGANCGATFDGRKAHTAFSDGCSATQGRDVNGPTAMINSLTHWDQQKFLGGMVVNVKFSKSHMKEDKKKFLVQMIRAFIKQGGIEMQINSVDRETLEDAVIHPENHGDLVVRIGGYSDYFVRLTPETQKEVISRTEY